MGYGIAFLFLSAAWVAATQNTTFVNMKLISLILNISKYGCDHGLPHNNCDPYLKICLGQLEKKPLCDIMYVYTSSTDNKHYIEFGNMIGDKPNPTVVEFTGFPGALFLIVDLLDADFPPIDRDDKLVTLFKDNISLSTYPSPDVAFRLRNKVSSVHVPDEITLRGELKSGFAELRLSLWAHCSSGWFGSKCEVKCVPQHAKNTGHYGCDILSGKRYCIPGWYGQDCNLIDLCATRKPCGPMGRCVNTDGGFICQCQEPFTGLLCTENPHSCPTAAWPYTEDLLAPYCQNGGTCVVGSNGAKRCICTPGFVGVRCQYDVDECTHWTSLYTSEDKSVTSTNLLVDPIVCHTPGHTASPCCGHNATCLNTWGGYKCVCPVGWSGLNCEFPPVLWPDGYEPVVNATVDYGYVADQLNKATFNQLRHTNTISRNDIHGRPWVIAFSVVFVLLLILLSCVAAACAVRTKRKRRSDAARESQRSPIYYTRADQAQSFHRRNDSRLPTLPLPSAPKSTVYTRAPPKPTEYASGDAYYRSPPDGSSKKVYEELSSASNTTYDFLYSDEKEYEALFDREQQENHDETPLPQEAVQNPL